MFEILKQKVGDSILQSKARTLKRRKEFYNFKTAKTAGVIFCADKENSYIEAKSFIQFLEDKGMAVFGLGYVFDKSKLGHFPYHKGIDYFSVSNLNWYNKPQNTVIDEFIEQKVDLLIDLSLSETFPIRYIFALSRAAFKISGATAKALYSDLNFEIKGKEKQVEYVGIVKKYLNTIEKK